jgi:superoxide dismutase
MKNLKKFSVMAFAAIFFFAACKKDEDNATPNQNNPGEPQAQSMKVKMTDAPGDFEALNVTITSVDAYIEGEGWINLNNDAQSMNVLSLTNGTETTIASQTNAKTGVYSKLRVKFDQDAKLQLNSTALIDFGGVILAGNTVQLGWMSTTSNEVEININEEVNASSGAEILLDFDVASSIEQRTNEYVLNPTIKVMKNANTGVRGNVKGSSSSAIMLTDGQNSFSTFTDAQGNFMIRGVESGTYKLMVDAAAKTKSEVNKNDDKVIDGVVIANGEIKQMGTITVE